MLDVSVMFTVRIPRENTNDDEVKIVDVLVKEGQQVERHQVLAVIETTKVTFELQTEEPGWVRGLTAIEGQRVRVGDILCHVTDGANDPVPSTEADKPEAQAASTDTGDLRFTRRARELFDRHGLSPDQFRGRSGLITETDVNRVIGGSSGTARAPAGREAEETKTEFSSSAIVIFGGGGRARVCIDLLRLTGGYEIIGVIDDKLPPGTSVLGVPVIGGRDRLTDLRARGVRFAVNALGSAEHAEPRLVVHRLLETTGFVQPNLIHPRAMVEPSVVMGTANHILAGAIVGSAVRLGSGVTVNCGAIASHDSVLDDHVHLAPGAILAGSVHVGAESLVGMGATVYLKVRLGRRVRIKNGSHVFGNVPDGETR